MPILRLTKRDPDVAVVQPTEEMALQFVEFDRIAYNFDWTGRAGLLPLSAVERAINPNSRQPMLRSAWILTDAPNSGFWDAADTVTVLSNRFASRLAIPPPLTPAPLKLAVMGPYDRLAFSIGAKNPDRIYAIEIMINTLDEGDISFPETPITP